MLAPNTVLQNRYLVIRHLSKGGMGAVYLVRHQRLGKTFALKETFFSDNDELRKAFEHEAQLLAYLEHPALPKVTDHFTEGESQYLLMEYIPGEDLGRQLKAQQKPFPVGQVLEWADQLLDALDYLHSHAPPIIHRDIKPENLKLKPNGKIVLLDFGLAKGSVAEMTRQMGSVWGYTLDYAPMEQIKGTGTDERSDLYSLGATLYHLLTGKIPPHVTDRNEAVGDGRPDPLRPVNEENPEVPGAVAAVLQQAMARNRDQRPQSASAMREALRVARQETAVEPHPTLPAKREDEAKTLPLHDALLYRQAAPHKSHRKAWIIGGLGTLLLVGILMLISHYLSVPAGTDRNGIANINSNGVAKIDRNSGGQENKSPNIPTNSATPTPSPQMPQAQSSPSSTTISGARVSITADRALNDYSAYRSGNYYIIILPKTKMTDIKINVENGAAKPSSQERGSDLILEFSLSSGMNVRVEQRLNHLDVIFSSKG